MFRFARRPKSMIVALCVAVVALRVAGLHAHLCMDGSEPPLTVHIADSGVHHLDETLAGESHADRDMTLAADLVVKKPSGDLDLALLAAFCALLLFLLARPRQQFDFLPLPIPRSGRPRLRPPLRGPPLSN